ncbi:isoleucyl-tRNA synthetase [Myriangium duriaei CBS 260.36]|uniref:isoleucine--tRNA ligase n=1 Tax=Myriangium duriaei CBS 260.36 TaxID=1168546 RepID=A0A9P4IU71_9PEZI|nr:isoleucyl-tRNA synthetase [Myriangium duriaei CBS 260.36]
MVILKPSRILRLAQQSGGGREPASQITSWSQTLQLPRTSFPSRPFQQDLDTYRKRCTDDLYVWQKENRPTLDDEGDDNTFVLHDGPPYANGAVHVGHAVNKILKDLLTRTALSRGKNVSYRPGWDCHGLPIELRALKASSEVETGKKASKAGFAGGEAGVSGVLPKVDALTIRDLARNLAKQTVKEQSQSFQSWGVMGDWDKPYLTMDKDFEIRQLGVFKEMVSKGLIYRQNKPVHWSPSSRTALAEAELEYEDNHKVTAAYIKFPITKLPPILADNSSVDPARIFALIWTTTPWTLPANTAIGIRSDMTYTLIELPEQGQILVAKERLESLKPHFKDATPRIIIDDISGAELVGSNTEYFNVLSGKTSKIVHADLVTALSGTGLVHLAAGHGMEDYLALKTLGFSDVFAPVDDEGKFTAEAFPSDPARLQGLYVESKGSKAVLEILREHQGLSLVLDAYSYQHRNPIDWRTKQPIIVRATDQWFADVESLQERAIESLEEVTFIPESGENRLKSFLKGRSQWCISRQRAWGVPIPALHHKSTGEAVMTVESVEHIISVINERGTDAWWSDAPDDAAWVSSTLPPGDYIRGKDTMDVWFDSGTSWTSLAPRDGRPRADAYVEGSDQHRGWFQSSVLTHVSQSQESPALPPFGVLLTHGFTLDSAGRKMSKSLGNVVTPTEILNGVLTVTPKNKSKSDRIVLAAQADRTSTLGPDALRLWVASSDVTHDISISQPSITAVHQALGKYRVTFKWLLGVLADYPSPTLNPELLDSLRLADQFVLYQLSKTAALVHEAQQDCDFPTAVKEINRFINADLSAAYFEIVKDRVYAGSIEDRVHIQTVLYIILEELMQMLAPITPLLVEEVWAHFPPERRAEEAEHPLRKIYDEPWSTVDETGEDKFDRDTMEYLQGLVGRLTTAVRGAQEVARKEGKLGSGLACEVEILIPAEAAEEVREIISELDAEEELAELLVVSGVDDEVFGQIVEERLEWRRNVPWSYEAEFEVDGEEEGKRLMAKVVVLPPSQGKCERCWKYTALEEEAICERCQDVLGVNDKEGEEMEGEQEEEQDEDDEELERGGGETKGRDLRDEKRRSWKNVFGFGKR